MQKRRIDTEKFEDVRKKTKKISTIVNMLNAIWEKKTDKAKGRYDRSKRRLIIWLEESFERIFFTLS